MHLACGLINEKKKTQVIYELENLVVNIYECTVQDLNFNKINFPIISNGISSATSGLFTYKLSSKNSEKSITDSMTLIHTRI